MIKILYRVKILLIRMHKIETNIITEFITYLMILVEYANEADQEYNRILTQSVHPALGLDRSYPGPGVGLVYQSKHDWEI